MWSNWLEDAKKKAGEAFKATSQIMSDGLQAAKKRAEEITMNAADVMKEMVTRRPEDMTYITSNLIAMGFPGWPKNPNRSIKYNTREIVAAYLEEHHKDHYMIFNLSDEVYETILFGDHIISYDLLGMPAPSLGMLMKICVAIETWLQDSDQNVAVVHCLTGKGRTLTVCACLLAWLGWMDNCSEALHLCCSRRGGRVEDFTTPSQRRYVQYFGMMLDCIPPKKEAMLLRSIQLNQVPLMGPNPVVQVDVFNCGTLIFATRVTIPADVPEEEFAMQMVEIPCGRLIRGNIIIRCRQLKSDGTRRSLCRSMIHTGYVSGPTLRLTKDQLDGACNDSRYPEDMSLELGLEETTGDYQMDPTVNRMEAYEGLLLDEHSALWRELLHRKERRSTPTTPPAISGEAAQSEKTTLFDIESDEEEEVKKLPLPQIDPGRDYMMELAMLESSLTDAQKKKEEKKEKEEFTAEEEQNLDTMLQSLDIESGDETNGENVDNIDLDALGESMSDVEDTEMETRDFNAEFGL